MVTIRFEGLLVELPDGVELEFIGGALRLHAVNLTGTLALSRDGSSLPDAPARAAPAPAPGCRAPEPQPTALVDGPSGRRGRATKRSPDSDQQIRTTKAVRTMDGPHTYGGGCAAARELDSEGLPNGPLSPQSDDWGEAGRPTGSVAPRSSQPRALDAEWSDMVSGHRGGDGGGDGARAADGALAAELREESALGEVLPVAWRWRRVATPAGPAPRWGHSGVLVADSLFFVCGGEGPRADGVADADAAALEHVPLADLWALDLRTRAWTRRRDAACARTWHSCCAGFLSPSERTPTLLLMGGETAAAQPPTAAAGATGVVARAASAEMVAYDTAADSWFAPWSSGAPPSKRSGHSGTLVRDKLYVFGGSGARKPAEPEMWAVDCRQWKWSKLGCTGKPPFARTYHSATRIGGARILVFAGNDAERSFGKGRVHVFDCGAQLWTHPEVRGELPAARTGHVAVAFGGRHVLVHGGWDYDASGEVREFQDDAALLDTETWVWTKVQLEAAADGHDGRPRPRTGHVAAALGRAALAALGAADAAGAAPSAGPALLIHGGMTNDGVVLGDTWVLEPLFATAGGD